MRALYVATDLRDADVLQQEVRRAAPKLTFDVCSGTAEARTRTEGALNYDVMILDSSLPEQEQQQLIEHVRSRQIPLPIVILVGQGATPSSAIVSAADECITRGPRLAERLAPACAWPSSATASSPPCSRENERLKRSEARLRLIIEAMPAGVVLVDQTGKIQAMNLAGAALVGTGGPSRTWSAASSTRSPMTTASRPAGARHPRLRRRARQGRVHLSRSRRRDCVRCRSRRCASRRTRRARARCWACSSPATGEMRAAGTARPVERRNGRRLRVRQRPAQRRAHGARAGARGDARRGGAAVAEAENERGRVQQVLEELERSRRHHRRAPRAEEPD